MCFFFQAEDGIRYLVRSRGLGDVYKRQSGGRDDCSRRRGAGRRHRRHRAAPRRFAGALSGGCLLYTSDAADERSSVDLGGRRIIKKKTSDTETGCGQDSVQHNSGGRDVE